MFLKALDYFFGSISQIVYETITKFELLTDITESLHRACASVYVCVISMYCVYIIFIYTHAYYI